MISSTLDPRTFCNTCSSTVCPPRRSSCFASPIREDTPAARITAAIRELLLASNPASGGAAIPSLGSNRNFLEEKGANRASALAQVPSRLSSASDETRNQLREENRQKHNHNGGPIKNQAGGAVSDARGLSEVESYKSNA